MSSMKTIRRAGPIRRYDAGMLEMLEGLAHIRRAQHLRHRAEMRHARRTEAALENRRPARLIARHSIGDLFGLLVRPQIKVRLATWIRAPCCELLLFRLSSAQNQRHRLMHPRIDLQLADFFRRKPQLHAAVRAHEALMPKTAGVFHASASKSTRRRAGGKSRTSRGGSEWESPCGIEGVIVYHVAVEVMSPAAMPRFVLPDAVL